LIETAPERHCNKDWRWVNRGQTVKDPVNDRIPDHPIINTTDSFFITRIDREVHGQENNPVEISGASKNSRPNHVLPTFFPEEHNQHFHGLIA
jgi:hypothetical protein